MEDGIEIVCGACEFTWIRDPSPSCPILRIPGTFFAAVAAIVQKSRGTQLSIVGSRVIHLCEDCDEDTIAYYLRTRPNPLMPDRLPNAPGEQG